MHIDNKEIHLYNMYQHKLKVPEKISVFIVNYQQ